MNRVVFIFLIQLSRSLIYDINEQQVGQILSPVDKRLKLCSMQPVITTSAAVLRLSGQMNKYNQGLQCCNKQPCYYNLSGFVNFAVEFLDTIYMYI